MRYQGLTDFLSKGAPALAKGPVGMIFVEDLVEVESTILHHQKLGFAELLVFAPDELNLPSNVEDTIHRIPYAAVHIEAVQRAVNSVITAAPGTWLYYCYNAEYLFYPFCETRSIGELLAFQTEERRAAALTYVVDLYADDLGQYPNAVSTEHAFLDKSGYYALGRPDANNNPHDRQLDFFGGLRWRFEEYIPPTRRKIDRISLFRAQKGLVIRENHTFNKEEYNTYACPWHNNVTVAIASFRTAKALKSNSGSTFDIPSFKWHNSVQFEWSSRQLLDMGLMEPGQWF